MVVMMIAAATDAPPFERTSHNTIVWQVNIDHFKLYPQNPNCSETVIQIFGNAYILLIGL